VKSRTLQSGFTLAELLIALAILGVIATFTIPKILQAQQDSKYNAIAKEDAAAMSAAIQTMRYRGLFTDQTSMNTIATYINYLKIDSTSVVDDTPSRASGIRTDEGGGSFSCGTGNTRCLKMANGSIILYPNSMNFDLGTGANAIWFLVDPDGTYNQSPSVLFFVYDNGRVRTWGTVNSNTEVRNDGLLPFNPNPAEDPSWFSW
jgi:prepilin-type N-terminal cleavage/methylation domain-containing protein